MPSPKPGAQTERTGTSVFLDSLRGRITLILVLLVLFTTAATVLITNVATTNLFDNYLALTDTARALNLASFFEGYYRDNGGWSGVQNLLEVYASANMSQGMMGRWRDNMGRHGMNRPFGPIGPSSGTTALPADRLIVANADGVIVGDSAQLDLGGTAAPQQLAAGAPLMLNGEAIGTLIVTNQPLPGLDSLEEQFTGTAARYAWLAAGGAIILALLLGFTVSRSLTQPLQSVVQGTERLANGELSVRVKNNRRDELGTLAHSFNRMAEQLRSNEELRKNLVADIAHELRTPISVLRGNLESIQEGVQDPDMRTIVNLHDEVLRMASLVNELQELSLLDAGQARLNREKVLVQGVVQEEIEALGAMAQGDGISLLSSLPDQPVLALVDRRRTGQILRNLLVNALRHTPSGGEVRVSVELTVDGRDSEGPGGHSEPGSSSGPGSPSGPRGPANSGFARVSVSDTGEGVAPGDLPHVFERFYKADRSRTRGRSGEAKEAGVRGTGLGLAIARGYATAQGGDIWLESSHGNGSAGAGTGSTFTFTLPLA